MCLCISTPITVKEITFTAALMFEFADDQNLSIMMIRLGSQGTWLFSKINDICNPIKHFYSFVFLLFFKDSDKEKRGTAN